MTADLALVSLAFVVLVYALSASVILVKRACQHWIRFSQLMDRIASDIR